MNEVFKYFPDLTERQRGQFLALPELYAFWNAQINVISRKDMDAFCERHVLHSLGIAKVLSFRSGTTVLDVGTGGGFPGIPLAILFPESRFTLVDSTTKKIKVVREVAAAIGLDNVQAEAVRAEKVDDEFEFVVSRAVTRLAPFMRWIEGKVSPNSFHDLLNGVLYLKGGDLEEEIRESGHKARIFDLSEYFGEPFFETKKVVHIPVKN
ncbi:16S rRNA (guanine(527)-N(7))-methyltransferase RsmG [Ravibacter arvi]|uniref:Ribosomal RNA small subunit methyltransferase G n=1 Tax=Ravibacter arvi TaxID=2051041 RepID=A0ABP8LRX0_9BACT